MTCGQVRTSNNVRSANRIPFSENEMAMEVDEEEEMNNIIIDDSDVYQASTIQDHDRRSGPSEHNKNSKIDDTTFDTYDFMDNPSAIYYNVDNGKDCFPHGTRCIRKSKQGASTISTNNAHYPNLFLFQQEVDPTEPSKFPLIFAVQIATGCVVGVLILIAVIIIIVLVFRR